MLLVTPCTDWYLIFTDISKGNVPLGSSILPVNLILQILLLPLYLWLLMGSSVSFDPFQLLFGVLLVLFILFAGANLMKWRISKTKYKDSFFNFVSQHGDNIQLLFLCLAVIAMFSSQGKLILANPIVFLKLFVPLIIFFTLNFILALLTGKRLKMPFEDTIALLFTTSARNSPIALAIAVIAFPNQPMIALALVIGPLIELPILALDSSILKRINKSNNQKNL
jgi:ACR3 family arsenite efflux pump ArsB